MCKIVVSNDRESVFYGVNYGPNIDISIFITDDYDVEMARNYINRIACYDSTINLVCDETDSEACNIRTKLIAELVHQGHEFVEV